MNRSVKRRPDLVMACGILREVREEIEREIDQLTDKLHAFRLVEAELRQRLR